MEYKKRIADKILTDKLDSSGAVLVEGPKYCGKTTLAKQQAGSVLSMADPDTLSQNLALAKTNISRLLAGATPRLIDEWQIAPQFWDAVRNEVDKREADGQFILTGSAVPPKPKKDENGKLICRGGWPKAVLKRSEKAALAQAFNYYDSVVSNDIKRVDDVDRDEELAKRIMRSCTCVTGRMGLLKLRLAVRN